ncbi:MAG: hypothetical protein WD875_09220 [Pirellulales bacterium]
MSEKTTAVLIPVFLITVGVGWLLTTLGIAPGIDWVWTLGLAVVGLLAFVLGGFNKLTATVGPFFLIGSCLSVLRQSGRLHVDIEMPILAISAGVLLLVVRHPAIPMPKWLSQEGRGGTNT